MRAAHLGEHFLRAKAAAEADGDEMLREEIERLQYGPPLLDAPRQPWPLGRQRIR
jgi:gluconate kinase